MEGFKLDLSVGPSLTEGQLDSFVDCIMPELTRRLRGNDGPRRPQARPKHLARKANSSSFACASVQGGGHSSDSSTGAQRPTAGDDPAQAPAESTPPLQTQVDSVPPVDTPAAPTGQP
jgi:hypothetical protein